MSDTTGHGIPASVLERAAAQCIKSLVYDREQLVRFVIKPALPILRPAIEAALLERMIAESQDWDCTSECDFSGDGEDYEAVFTRRDLARILRTYLPTATEGVDE